MPVNYPSHIIQQTRQLISDISGKKIIILNEKYVKYKQIFLYRSVFL